MFGWTLVEFETSLAIKVDLINAWLIEHQLLVAIQLIVASVLFLYYIQESAPIPKPRGPLTKENSRLPTLANKSFKNPMQAPDVILNEPLETTFTVEELAQFNGMTEGKPIYVAMKGLIFDGQLRFSLLLAPD